MDERVWDVSVFTKNRERLMQGEISQRLVEAVLEPASEHGLLSEEHFTVDGTLIRAWANRRSFRPKPDPPERGSGLRGLRRVDWLFRWLMTAHNLVRMRRLIPVP